MWRYAIAFQTLAGQSARAPGLTLLTLYVTSESSLWLPVPRSRWDASPVTLRSSLRRLLQAGGRNRGGLPCYQHCCNKSPRCRRRHTARAGLAYGLQPATVPSLGSISNFRFPGLGETKEWCVLTHLAIPSWSEPAEVNSQTAAASQGGKLAKISACSFGGLLYIKLFHFPEIEEPSQASCKIPLTICFSPRPLNPSPLFFAILGTTSMLESILLLPSTMHN